MLELIIPESEWYDEKANRFYDFPETKLILEHSLLAVSKWEAKWKKPFLVKEDKSEEEFLDYIRCMTLNEVEDEGVYDRLRNRDIRAVSEYMKDPQTASKVYQLKKKDSHKNQIATSEQIYFWMSAANIPFECEKWNLNRLFTLLKICEVENSGESNKNEQKDTRAYYKELNEARRAKFKSKG